jgi:hypothetical protein
MRRLLLSAAIAALTIPAHAKIIINHVKTCEGSVTANDNHKPTVYVQIGDNNTGTFCFVNGAVAGNANLKALLASAHVRFKAVVDRHDHVLRIVGKVAPLHG